MPCTDGPRPTSSVFDRPNPSGFFWTILSPSKKPTPSSLWSGYFCLCLYLLNMKVIKLTESDLTNIVKRVIKESNSKDYSRTILAVLEGFENDYVCGFDVDYQEDTEIYLIKTIIGNMDLDKDILTNAGQRNYLNSLKKDITEYLIGYLPIRFLVDFKRTPKCSDYKKYKQMTESDLTQIVKQVIIENNSKNSLINLVREDGWQTASKYVGGIENLKRLLRIETPMDFLNIFTDLDVVQSEEEPNLTLFRYEQGNNMMIYDRKIDYVLDRKSVV